MRVLSLATAGLLLVLGPAARADGGLFSVTKPAFGLVDGVLFAGEGTGSVDGTGTLAVVSQPGEGQPAAPRVACRGRFDHDFKTGTGALSCDNGETANFIFRFTGLTRGVGEGESKNHGTIRFTFGLDTAEAAKELRLPEGARIVATGAARDGAPAYRLDGVPAGAEAVSIPAPVPPAGTGPLPSPSTAPGAASVPSPAPSP